MSDHSKLILTKPRLLCILEKLDNELYSQVKNIALEAEDFLERIPEFFPTYTMHNIEHSIRILENVYELIDPEYISEEPLSNYNNHLSPLEIATIIYGAVLHDIGMFIDDVEIIRKIKTNSLEWCDDKYYKLVEKFKGNETLALQDYIRRIHARLSSIFIKEKFAEKLHIPNSPAISYLDEIADLCESHNQNIEWIRNSLDTEVPKGRYKCNYQFCALLLRLGDILDFDSRRTPYHLFKSINLMEHSEDEWNQHLIIESTGYRLEKSSTYEGWKSPLFYGKCTNPTIYRKILTYFDWIEGETRKCSDFSLSFHHTKYHIKITGPIVNRVQTIGFDMANQQLKMDYEAITNLLMGEKIYGSPIFGIRELVQNSIDACMLRLELSKGNQTYEEKYIPKISIIFDKKQSKIVIKDNGTGMNDYILNEYFLSIGKSYYKSDDFLLKDYNFKAIGNFGIGFLACFMLSDRVNIKTKYYNESVVHELNVEKNSKYIVYKRGEKADFSHGTEIAMDYDFEKNFLSFSREMIRDFVETQFLLDSSFIHVIDLNNIEIADTTIQRKMALIFEKTRRENGIFIDLAPYFNEISGILHINLSKSDHSFLSYSKETFQNDDESEQRFLGYFDGTNIKKLDETDIAKCVKDNAIHYSDIYFVPSEIGYDFDRMLEVLDDEKEVFEKKDDFFPYITLLLDKQMDCKDIDRKLVRQSDQWLHYQKITQKLGEYGNKYGFFYVRNHQFRTLRVENENLNIKLSHYYNYNRMKKLFIKNVFIKDLVFDTLALSHDACEISSIIINSTNSLVQANVSRSDIETSIELDIQYSMMKFCHLIALQYYKDDFKKANQLQHVINKFFSEKSAFLNYEQLDEIQYREVKSKNDIDELLKLF
jgi:molecular chaperone HtpG